MGEIGLAGELRRVRDLPQRLAEAARLGFRVAVVPAERGADGPRPARTREIEGMKVIEVPDVASALRLLASTTQHHVCERWTLAWRREAVALPHLGFPRTWRRYGRAHRGADRAARDPGLHRARDRAA